MEYISPKKRTIGLNLCIGVFYCLGSVITPWMAVFLGHWKRYLLATILPALTVPFFYFVIPESAQWLISNKQLDRAIESFKKIAKFNGKHLDDEFVEEFRANAQLAYGMKPTEVSSNSFIGLFKTKRLRRLTLILFFKS